MQILQGKSKLLAKIPALSFLNFALQINLRKDSVVLLQTEKLEIIGHQSFQIWILVWDKRQMFNKMLIKIFTLKMRHLMKERMSSMIVNE